RRSWSSPVCPRPSSSPRCRSDDASRRLVWLARAGPPRHSTGSREPGLAAGAGGLEEGAHERLAGSHDPLVRGADDVEELDEMLTGPVAVGVGRDPDGVDEPPEGVLDMAPEEVEV